MKVTLTIALTNSIWKTEEELEALAPGESQFSSREDYMIDKSIDIDDRLISEVTMQCEINGGSWKADDGLWTPDEVKAGFKAGIGAEFFKTVSRQEYSLCSKECDRRKKENPRASTILRRSILHYTFGDGHYEMLVTDNFNFNSREHIGLLIRKD